MLFAYFSSLIFTFCDQKAAFDSAMMMKILVVLTSLAVLFLAVESRKYKYHLVLKPDVFDVYWSVNTTDPDNTFYFKFVAKTTGWAALGWSRTSDGSGMRKYDIALGGVKNNSGYLWDYFSPTKGKPEIDQNNQDLVLVNVSEAGGFTTIEFTRHANTYDSVAADVPLENGTKIWLMWAIAPTDATDRDRFVKHNDRDYTRVAYNMFTGEQFDASTGPSAGPGSSTTSKPSSTTASTTSPSVAVNIMASLTVVVLLQLSSMLLY